MAAPPAARPGVQSASTSPLGGATGLVGLAMGAVGGLILAGSLPALAHVDLAPLVLLTALVVAARAQTVPVYGRASYSISTVPVLAAGMLLGVAGGVVVALASGLAHALFRRLPWYKALFNCGNYVLAASLAATVFHAAGARLASNNLPFLLALAVATGLIHYTHMLLTAVAIAVEHRTSPLRAWTEEFAWLWPQWVVLGVLAVLLALAYHEFGLAGAAAFVAPPVLMLYTAKQYVDHTTDSVRQLRGLNDELLALNDDLARAIRQREATEEENARLAHEAARAAALEELSHLKSRFISVASHELRTPLTAVVGYADLVLADTDKDDPRYAMLATTQRCARQLAGLVDNLLDASRIEAGQLSVQPTTVDLEAAVAAVLEVVRGSATKHTLVAAVGSGARWVCADPDRLRQILMNLVGNAVKYSPAGGQVLVAARPSPDGSIELSVSDQGLGIPADEVDRIFDPYQRVNSTATRRIKGTGLGLYIVRHLVELHGGTIRVESAVGRGSTFSVALPSAPSPDAGAKNP
ncbi:MAG TPA: HAMP domain-containing sensor histidine kinase [Chloroflexota bacterium]